MTTHTPLPPDIRFPVGDIYATRGALDAFHYEHLIDALDRHTRGDWGDLDLEDQRANAAALEGGARLLSAYHYNGQKLWVITEADRSSTTLLLPSEY